MAQWSYKLGSANALVSLTSKLAGTKVFGYYLEASKAHSDKIPEDYIRKQSLVNGERFITPEMKEWGNSRILKCGRPA